MILSPRIPILLAASTLLCPATESAAGEISIMGVTVNGNRHFNKSWTVAAPRMLN